MQLARGAIIGKEKETQTQSTAFWAGIVGGGAQGDDNTLAYNPAGVSFKEQDAVFIDPNGQLQEHLAATRITQQDVDQLGPTQQPAATVVGAAGGMGVATAVGAAGGMVAQAQPPGGAAGIGNLPPGHNRVLRS
jgi:hypothetical protein